MRWLDGITNSMDMSLSKLLGNGKGQGSLVCCSSWGLKESDTTERLSLSLFYFPVIMFKHLFLYLPCKDYRAPTLDRLMLKLTLQYFGHLMRRTDSFEKP